MNVKITLITLAVLGVFGSGWWLGNSRYIEYKKSVEIVAKAQEAKVESIQKQQELVTKGISNEYEAKLSAIRNYYHSNSVWKPSTSAMSSVSNTPSATDVISSYNLLAGQCAETTAQTVALQDWINAQIGVK